MSYVGDITLGDTLDIKFTTRRFSTGVPYTLAGSPVISAYVGNSVTQITAGITLTVDFDGVTGLNNVRIVATVANGFAAATNVALVITVGTVDSVSVVGENIGAFSINNRFTALVDAVWDEVLSGATHNIVNSAARRLRALAGADVLIWSGTAQAGSTSTTIKIDAGAPATTDIFKGSTVVLTGSTGAGQVRRIVSYNGTTKVVTVDRAWVVTPSATTTFEIVAGVGSRITDEGTAQAGAAGSITLASTASASDDVYVDAMVTIQAGTGAGQTKIITAYNGTTKVATVSGTFSPVPDTASVYAVIPSALMADDTIAVPTSAENAAAVTAVLSSPFIKNEAFPGFCFEMVNALDHVSEMPGLTVTAQRSIDGGAYAACTNAPVGVANGTYAIDLSAADLNGNFITLRFTATGADATKIGIKTQELVP